jgi:hypothetical protein
MVFGEKIQKTTRSCDAQVMNTIQDLAFGKDNSTQIDAIDAKSLQ